MHKTERGLGRVIRAKAVFILWFALAAVAALLPLLSLWPKMSLAQKSQVLTASANPTPIRSSASLGGSSSPVISIQLATKDIHDAFLSITRDEAWLKALGIGLTVVIVLSPVILSLYVNSRVDSSGRIWRTEIQNDLREREGIFQTYIQRSQDDYHKSFSEKLQSGIDSHKEALAAAICDIQKRGDQLESNFERITNEIEWKFQEERVSNRNAVAYLYWKGLRDPKAAADYSEQALRAVELAFKALRLDPQETARVAEKSLGVFSCNLKGNLAYYYAESFERTEQHSDGMCALRYVREMLQEAARVLSAPLPIHLVDTYIFVISRVPTATGEEVTRARTWFKDRSKELKHYVVDEMARPELWETYHNALRE